MAKGTSNDFETETYNAEISDTLDSVTLRETLQFDLDITEREYKSDHEISGELRLEYKPTKKALKNRESPPISPLLYLAQLLDKEVPIQGYPGTRAHIAFSKATQNSQNKSFVEPNVTGLPENETLSVDATWSTSELKDMLAEDNRKIETKQYDITGFPSSQLPIIVRAKLYRDAVELYRDAVELHPELDREQTQPEDKRERERRNQKRKNMQAKYEGLSALSIALEHRSDGLAQHQRISLDRFRVDMSQTFPDIRFSPEQGSTYNPEQKRVEWNSRISDPGDISRYIIVGPIEQLLDLGKISAQVSGHIENTTLSDRAVTDIFDQSGQSISRSVQTTHEVDIECSIEIDPDALSGQVQRKTKSTVHVIGLPDEVYTEIEDVCRREGIHIRDQNAPGEAEPATDREGVWEVKGQSRGELDVKREYGNQGVVYATILVTGEYTPSSQEKHVSASTETSDKLVRADQGALDSRGRTTIEIDSRSASSELNTQLINTFEDAFPGGEAK